MDRQKAKRFVQEQGDEVAQARLRWLLAEERPSPAILQSLFSSQRDDGGFAPFWAPDYSSVDATCYRLAQAEQLGLGVTTPAVADAIRFLLWRQEEDGRFAEEAAVADSAPPWAQPGDLAATLYLTANAGFWLTTVAHARSAAENAAAFLAQHLQDGQLPSFLQAHWLAAGLWQRLGQAETAVPVFAYLQTRLPQMDADDLAWLLYTLLLAGASAELPVVSRAADRLEKLQEEDGRFPDVDGQDVHVTLAALRVWKLLYWGERDDTN